MAKSGPKLGRRAFVRGAGAAATSLWLGRADAGAVDVPLRLQVALLAKVAAYDRNFAARAQGEGRILVVVRPEQAESRLIGAQLLGELGGVERIGGLPHREELLNFSTPERLVEACKTRAATITYFSTGFNDPMESIARELQGISILSVSAASADVTKGVVLGFDTESGKPKLFVNLAQARRQQVAFAPELLKLAKVLQ